MEKSKELTVLTNKIAENKDRYNLSRREKYKY